MKSASRRRFNKTIAGAALAATTAGPMSSLVAHDNQVDVKAEIAVCGFVKFIQSLSYDEMAETMAEMGYQGIEATIRPKGMILPEDAKAELPKLVKALDKRKLKVLVMTTNVNQPNDKVSRELLEVASDLGIQRYRTDYYRYDLNKPILPQLETFRPQAASLAKLNEQLGITGVYQNHAGARNVGSTAWDLLRLLSDINPKHLGIAFDIRHATASAGTSWPIYWDILKPHLQAIYVKDFIWNGAKMDNVPLGEGMISKKFFDEVSTGKFRVPVSLHVEYLTKAGLEPNIEGLKNDIVTLHKLLKIR